MSDPRYPLGKFAKQASYTAAEREIHLEVLRQAPAKLKAALEGLTAAQLETPYREDGWTVRQVVHHMADSHMNAYVRIKLAITEANPTVKSYDEQAWALLPDNAVPLEVSVGLLEGLHLRLVVLLEAMAPTMWQRTYNHPSGGLYTIEQVLAMYAWHSEHHLAHINMVKNAQ